MLSGAMRLTAPRCIPQAGCDFGKIIGGPAPAARLVTKLIRVLASYLRLISYATLAPPRIYHILWNYKFEHIDRTVLMLYYKFRRRKVVLTVHNVNAGVKADGNDSWLNRLTLRIQYRLADHLFVHTEQMKGEVLREFGVPERAVSVIPFFNLEFPFPTQTSQRRPPRGGSESNPGRRRSCFLDRFGLTRGWNIWSRHFSGWRRRTRAIADHRRRSEAGFRRIPGFDR